jgi:hypothetical protein
MENPEGVNNRETMTADLSYMAVFTLSRRALALALGGVVFALHALAAPAVVFPLRVGYARISEKGFLSLRADEQAYWGAMQTRLGGLIETIEPMQPANIIGAKAPEVDGGASYVLAARTMAADLGLGHVILYATHDGQRTYKHGGSWVARAFASLKSDLDTDSRAIGEAHLLDVAGGMPLASVNADVPPRSPLNLFDNRRNPEREALGQLTQGIERRLQTMARPQYDAERSIAD